MPTFSEYADACRLHHHKIQVIYALDMIPSGTNLIWICNPNNPTGSVLDKDVLKAFIEKHTECCFVIDQSYEFFTLKPLLSAREAAGYPNVILLHSMTKRFAVPGLRLGFMTANQILLREIRLQRMPWSVNQLAIEAGHYLLRHAGEYHVDISLLLKEKDRLAGSTACNRRNGGMGFGYTLYVGSVTNGAGRSFEGVLGRRVWYPYP